MGLRDGASQPREDARRQTGVRTLTTLAVLGALLGALTGCQWGAPPRIPYVDGTTYVEPDGRRTPIRGQREIGVSEVLRFADGLLVADTRWFEGSVGLAYVRGTRRTALGPCSTSGGRPSPDRRQVAWLTTGCPEATLVAETLIHVADADGGGGWTRQLDQHSLQFVAGFLGDAVVVSGWRDPVRVVPETGPVRVVPHLRYAADVHGTLVAGHRAVVDTATGALLWEAPGTRLVSFSPDGRFLVGWRGRDPVVVDARTGALRSTLPRRLDGLTWEDEEHLLAVAQRGRGQAMVRVGVDGRAELVGPVVAGDGYRYAFETQP
jgi:hypothetical protein